MRPCQRRRTVILCVCYSESVQVCPLLVRKRCCTLPSSPKTVRKLFESCVLCIFNPMASCWDEKTRGEGKRERRVGERQTETERSRGRHWETKSTSRRAFSLHPVLEWKNLCRVKGLGSDLALLCFMKPIDLKQIRFMLREPKFLIQKHSVGLTSATPSKADRLIHWASQHCPVPHCEFTCRSQSPGISQ